MEDLSKKVSTVVQRVNYRVPGGDGHEGLPGRS